MKKIRLILIVALAVSTIVSSSFALGLIRVKAVASTAVDPHQAVIQVCSFPPGAGQAQQDPSVQTDGVACEGGSANCDPSGCSLARSSESVAYTWGIDCLHITGADPCSTPLTATRLSITVTFENRGFSNTGERLEVLLGVNDALILNGNPPFARCFGTQNASPFCPNPGCSFNPDVPNTCDIIASGTNSGSFTIITEDPGVLTHSGFVTTSSSTNQVAMKIDSGEDIIFTSITAIVNFG